MQTEWAKFHLRCDDTLADPLHRLRALQRRGTALAEADPLYRALVDELAERVEDNLDGYVRVDAVLVVEIDVGGLQALEGALDGVAYVRRGGARATVAELALWVAGAELRRKEDLVAPAGFGEPFPER